MSRIETFIKKIEICPSVHKTSANKPRMSEPKNYQKQNKKLRAKLAKCLRRLKSKNTDYEDLERYTDEIFAEKEQYQHLCEAQSKELQDLKTERVELLSQIDFCKATETIKDLIEEARRNRACP